MTFAVSRRSLHPSLTHLRLTVNAP